MKKERIFLSAPNTGPKEKDFVASSLDSGWVAPVGPSINLFEQTLQNYYTGKSVSALNSGTSALHLALILAGVSDGDRIAVGSFTFAACANVILYERAIPIFLDSERTTWNLDPEILEDYLRSANPLPKAVIVTHLYGMPAQIQRIRSVCEIHGVVLIEDAAESFGSKQDSKLVGGFGHYGIVSFNGNKIITTSSGGALISEARDKQRAIHLATQANSAKIGYNHQEAGFNYRMSNILAGLGLAQLERLSEFISKKRSIFDKYKESLSDTFTFLDEPDGAYSNRWLTTCLLKNEDADVFELIQFLDAKNIESRPLWKPLHLHDAYSASTYIGTGVSEGIFKKGICLPSGTGLTIEEQQFVIEAIKEWEN
ncbi:MAG: DegT/DnrJ/EryC1/StrS family aminotransferase [Bacteroidota bacterium]